MCIVPQDREEYLRQLDADLRQRIQEARSYPDRSSERRTAVDRLIRKMLASGEIAQEGDAVYNDALLETMKWFGRNCLNYDSERAEDPEAATVIGWFKHTLYRYRIPDARRQAGEDRSRRRTQNGDTIIFVSPSSDDEGKEKDPIGNIVDSTQDPQAEIERRAFVTAMRHCIQQCRVLTTMHVPGHPEIHCQLLLLQVLPEWNKETQGWRLGASWEELEQEFGISKRQLRDCHDRHLTDLSKRHLQNCLAQCKIH